ncbi:MAG: hypothetical protein ABIS86_03435 [Streptosporangiaceae bacterium]
MTLLGVDRPVEAPEAPVRSTRLWPVLLMLGWLAQALVRWWFARLQPGPIMSADEVGYLMAARDLAGGVGGDLSNGTFYQAGYALLLVPIFWVTTDPDQVYAAIMVLNAVLGALMLPLAYLALRRFAFTPVQAFLGGNALALLPAAVWYGQLAWADSLLPIIVLAWLLCLHSFARSPHLGSALLSSSIAGYASIVHSRGLVILAVHLLALFILGWRRWVYRRMVFAALLTVGLIYFLGVQLNNKILGDLYPLGQRDLGGQLTERMTSLEGLARVFSGAAGQLWYMSVSTWGLAGLGLAAALLALLHRRTPRDMRVIAAVVLLAAVGVAMASAAALPVEHRVGNYAYGRYLSFMAVPFSLGGLYVLVRRSALDILIVGAGAVGIIFGGKMAVVAYAGSLLTTDQFFPIDFPETSFLSRDWAVFQIGDTTIIALAMVTALVVVGALCHLVGWVINPEAFQTTAVVFLSLGALVVNGAAVSEITTRGTRVWVAYFDGLANAPIKPGEEFALDQKLIYDIHHQLSFKVWWTTPQSFDARTEPPPPGTCLALVPVANPAVQVPAGWHPAGSYLGDWVAWRSDQCR